MKKHKITYLGRLHIDEVIAQLEEMRDRVEEFWGLALLDDQETIVFFGEPQDRIRGNFALDILKMRLLLPEEVLDEL